jgi:serine/threonine protein kinase
MPIKDGTILKNRYRIDRVLGQGGMGAVYEAFDVNLGVRVAVKENLFTTAEYERQFKREATILASLRHPNLPRVTDHFIIGGESQYLVMDFIEGTDLRDRLENEGAIPEEEALPWFLGICDALSYLHSRKPPILHRDIKPGNIKIMIDGRAVLVDFGLAKVVEEDSTTTTGAKAMTPGFSPPEQYGTGRTDPRTDIYSLGATIYTVLTACIPEDSIQRAMGREKLTPVRKNNPNVSQDVARVVEKALSVRSEDRYQSVSEMAIALSSVADSSRSARTRKYPYLQRTTLVLSDGLTNDLVTEPLEPIRSRRRLPAALLISLTLILIAVGAKYAIPGLSPWLADLRATTTEVYVVVGTQVGGTIQARASPTNGNVSIQTTSTVVSTPNGGTSSTPAPVVTPKGGGVGQIAYASDKTGRPQLYLINVEGTVERQLTSVEDGACQPAWSPNGKHLLFTSPCLTREVDYPGSSIWMISFDEADDISGPILVDTGPGNGNYEPAWDPDGERIAFTSYRDGRPQIYVMNLDGTDLEKLSSTAFAYDRQPAWSSSGTQLVYMTTRGDGTEIWIMPDYGIDEERFSPAGKEKDSNPDWSDSENIVVYERSIVGVPRLFMMTYENRGTRDYRICPEGEHAFKPMKEPHWSPDGNWIVFHTYPDGDNRNIAIMATGCTGYTELTSDPAMDFDPAWRPSP